MSPPRVRLFLVDSKATIWDRETFVYLREVARILGSFQGVKGVSNGATRGNFPALLMPEQAVVAIRRCAAEVYDGAPSTVHDDADLGFLPSKLPRKMSSREALEVIRSAGEGVEGAGPDVSLDDRIAVFTDLWCQGFRMLAGTAYGATYTVYEDDPDACHSCGSVLVMSGKVTMSVASLLAFIRLQGTVAKAAIIARVTVERGVEYSSFGFHFASSRPPLHLREEEGKMKSKNRRPLPEPT
jgi:tRNA splicing endonuclease